MWMHSFAVFDCVFGLVVVVVVVESNACLPCKCAQQK